MDMEGETNKQQSDQHVQEDKSKEETESSITDMKEETNKQQSDQSLSTKNGENTPKSGPAETEEAEKEQQEENNHHDQKSDNNPIQSSSEDMKEETNKQQSNQSLSTKNGENTPKSGPAETEEAEKEHQEEKHVQEDKSKEETESSITDMKEETNKQQSDQSLSTKNGENTPKSGPAETEEAEKEQQEENNHHDQKSDNNPIQSSAEDMKKKTNKQQSDHLTQMESYYKEELKKKDSTIQKIRKELKSLKDRLAQDMAVSIKTGDTESMNDPVSKTRLTEMYDSLKLEKWTGIKDLLKSNKTSPEFTRALVQKTFKEAAEEMIRKKQQIEETFGSTQPSGGQGNQKVEGYRKLAVHNLQLALYHSNKDLLKSPFPKYEGEKAEDVMVNLRRLTSECYWLGCLIALNKPDWETQHYMKNSWDIFPQRLKDCDK